MSNTLITRIEFYLTAKRNEKLSTPEAPHYDPKIYINFIRGDGTNWSRPSYDGDKLEYPQEWAAFQKSQAVIDRGSPLSDLHGVTMTEIATLKELGIVTIEGLSQSVLSTMSQLGERFMKLRDYASVYLQQRRDMEEVFSLKKKNEELELEVMRLRGDADKAVAPAPKAIIPEEPVGVETVDNAFVVDRKPTKRQRPIIETPE